jgi:hypothetical protein
MKSKHNNHYQCHRHVQQSQQCSENSKIDNLLVSTVAISQSEASIVFTISEDTAEDLLKHQHV